MDPTRAPVAFGRLAVPQLFAELQQPQEERRLPALASLCDLLHDPELIHQTLNRGTTRASMCAPGLDLDMIAYVHRQKLIN